MSVIQALEKYDKKHKSPDDDKAGWKRLIQGAVSKAGELLWTAGVSVDVSSHLSHSPDHIPNAIKFNEIRSPASDSYLSLPAEKSESNEDLFLSLDDNNSIKVVSPEVRKVLKPKSHSTPYKEKEAEKSLGSVQGPDQKESKILNKQNTIASISSTVNKNLINKNNSSEGSSQKKEVSGCRVNDVTDLCSEIERLSLKKIITEVEKKIACEIKEEFDDERRKIEEHDKRVDDILAREEEEREVKEQLLEMNWFQRIRDSQLQVEKDFNAKLDSVLAKTRKNKTIQNLSTKSVKSADEKAAELELVAKKRALIESIGNTQKSYNSKYNEIIHLLQSSSVALVSEFHSEFDTLKINNGKLTDVISKSKCGNVTQGDVDECKKLLFFLSNLFDKIKNKIDEYENAKKLEEEANEKLMQALRKNEENSKRHTTDKATTAVKEEEEKEETSVEVSNEFSKRRRQRLKYFKYVNKILKKAEESLEQFLNDDKYKNFRKDCQRAVNVPVNAISPTSAQHLKDKLDKLTDLLDGKSVSVMSRKFTATIHPLGIKYCEVLLARKIVKVGEDVVSSHPETGHAIASVVLSLMVRYPFLSVYLHAYFFRVCPYLVPLDLKPEENESGKDYNLRLGFTYTGDQREETDKFLKRMSGVTQLYGAILVANKRRNDSSLHSPLGMSELWIWLTNFISLEPLSDISATILFDLLEVSGHFMLTSYSYNFQKLLYFICTDYLIRIDKVTTKGRGGPVERLKTFLEDVIKVNRIPPPKGLLPPNFW